MAETGTADRQGLGQRRPFEIVGRRTFPQRARTVAWSSQARILPEVYAKFRKSIKIGQSGLTPLSTEKDPAMLTLPDAIVPILAPFAMLFTNPNLAESPVPAGGGDLDPGSTHRGGGAARHGPP